MIRTRDLWAPTTPWCRLDQDRSKLMPYGMDNVIKWSSFLAQSLTTSMLVVVEIEKSCAADSIIYIVEWTSRLSCEELGLRMENKFAFIHTVIGEFPIFAMRGRAKREYPANEISTHRKQWNIDKFQKNSFLGNKSRACWPRGASDKWLILAREKFYFTQTRRGSYAQ